MSFLLSCPNCGPRDVNEFAYAGEVTSRPQAPPDLRGLTDGKQRWGACYLKTEDIERCNRQAKFSLYPAPPELKARLIYLKQHHLNLFADQ